MSLLGERNWYLPRWLNWLPNLSHEAPVPPVTEPVIAIADGRRHRRVDA
jgi:RND superfamily putative drug exporter